MKRFTYKAIESKSGKTVKGAIQAETERAAGKLLIEQGLVPESIDEEETGGLLDKFKNKVSSKDKIVFTRQFATLIGAGLPLTTALRTVNEQTQSKPMKANDFKDSFSSHLSSNCVARDYCGLGVHDYCGGTTGPAALRRSW